VTARIEKIVTSGTFSLETVVRTGHGDDTTIGAEAASLGE
jgi:hypothetical protein